MIKRLSIGILPVVILFSCGGSGDDDNNKNGVTLKGSFIDEPVEGLIVENTNTNSSTFTNAMGEFSISGSLGDNLCFKIGNLLIGCTKADTNYMVVTPQIINPSKKDVIIALLHELDNDKNSTNSISIPKNIKFNVSSIERISIGDTLEYSLGNSTYNLSIAELPTEIMEKAEKNDLIAKAFNIIKQYEGKNLVTSPTPVNDIAKVTKFIYKKVMFDPRNVEIKLETFAEGDIEGTIYGAKVNGVFSCQGSNGKIYYDKLEKLVLAKTPFECNATVTYISDEGSGTETDNANCTAILKIDKANIDWQNKTVTGIFRLSCKFKNYSEFDFSYEDTISLHPQD